MRRVLHHGFEPRRHKVNEDLQRKNKEKEEVKNYWCIRGEKLELRFGTTVLNHEGTRKR